jgi:hypothetical protein
LWLSRKTKTASWRGGRRHSLSVRLLIKAQRAALREVRDPVGYVAQLIDNQRIGHVVDGHLRVALAISRGEPCLPVLYVDLCEGEERLVLASLDPLAAMATTDEARLRELLAEVSVESEALAAASGRASARRPCDRITRVGTGGPDA